MDLQTFCVEIRDRIVGSIEVLVYEGYTEVATSREGFRSENTEIVLSQEMRFDNIEKFGRGKHISTTEIFLTETVVVLTYNRLKVLIFMKPDSNIGLIYSLLPSISTVFSSIDL
ncbi:hypothetical protein EIN_083980 [Entamoeba invadens IP1]|uniref:hypothetical protein n=1 Tax=Entamoeba invadens IP1 TaxID=370355 RepID=UPI0002C3D08F|nr:hypothetical protein EIN_083980 [Entamoeba invadens IP1]ELP85246.1 hypothetical protein EIN_083980 [Entamoeba invadens IP1]|eukprot:XP_004184592.1 hypothetical protein EIN_083980 [Entamoeba invadens IP1]